MISRRDLLRTLGASALAFPLLESLAPRAKAKTSAFPTRLVIFFTPGGTNPPLWCPSGEGRDFTLSPLLEPLLPYKNDLIVLQGVSMESCLLDTGDGHARGMGHMLTGAKVIPGVNNGMGGGISVDQVIASRIGASTRLSSLELGACVAPGGIGSHMSYRGANQPVPVENDPSEAYHRIFGDALASADRLDARRARRTSVLGRVRGELQSLRTRLSNDDALKLEAHLDAIRAIEERLSAAASAACVVPTPPQKIKVNDAFLPDHIRLQTDLLVTSLACDVTRVASLMLSNAVSHTVYRWLGVTAEHHALTHLPYEVNGEGELRKINRWHAEQFAYLLHRMTQIREGDGTLLDHSVVLWCNELARGDVHSHDDIPFVLAGSANGYLKTGRFLRYPRQPGKRIGPPHNHLLVSLCHAMGLSDVIEFGMPLGYGPLPGLTG